MEGKQRIGRTKMYFYIENVGVINGAEVLCILKVNQTMALIVFKTGVEKALYLDNADVFLENFVTMVNVKEE